MGKGTDVFKMTQNFGSRTRIRQLSFTKITGQRARTGGQGGAAEREHLCCTERVPVPSKTPTFRACFSEQRPGLGACVCECGRFCLKRGHKMRGKMGLVPNPSSTPTFQGQMEGNELSRKLRKKQEETGESGYGRRRLQKEGRGQYGQRLHGCPPHMLVTEMFPLQVAKQRPGITSWSCLGEVGVWELDWNRLSGEWGRGVGGKDGSEYRQLPRCWGAWER